MEKTDSRTEERATRRRDVPADTFAARLILARHHAGHLSQREAAEKCGVNYASWSNWESGTRVRDFIETVEKISRGLGVDEQWLAFGGNLSRPQTTEPYLAATVGQDGLRRRVATRPIDSRPNGHMSRRSTRPGVRTSQRANRLRGAA
jgi:transcriptional regulator with XRE-family HTH domain